MLVKSADTNGKAKGENIEESAFHSLSTPGAPEFQFNLAMHSEVKTMFAVGY